MKFALVFLTVGALFLGWKLFSRSAYETAEYQLIVQEGEFEIRDYPELMVASTDMNSSGRGEDGSFMRLFRYIGGNNESKQKIAMTTPVFMDPNKQNADGKMSFVLPGNLAEERIPKPGSTSVKIESRPAGRYAVIRFSGRLNDKTSSNAEAKLRQWISAKGMSASKEIETAGYDPPITPGPFRRNEVIIRVK